MGAERTIPLSQAPGFKAPWFQGFIGEVVVNMAARLFLNKHDDHLIKNATIPTKKMRMLQTTQARNCQAH